MRVLVLADTHVRGDGKRRLPAEVYSELNRTDVILHAGDVLVADLLDELGRYAPVHAVLGNNDHGLAGRLPETLEVEIGGVAVAMIHDSGPTVGRAGRMHRRFPEAAVVVYGHSHIPRREEGIAGQILFNPGSATERRREPVHTFGILELDGGAVRRAEIVPVGPAGS